MDKEHEEAHTHHEGHSGKEENDNTIYYVIGVVAVISIITGAFFLWPKAPTDTSNPTSPVVNQEPSGPTPTPGPITGLACEKQYFNPVVGFPKYFFSVEGTSLASSNRVDCTFTVSVGGRTTATQTITGPLRDASERGGNTFRCVTREIEIQKTLPTKVEVLLKDDAGATASCSADYLLQ